jgi:hypothetical protein
MRKLEDMKEKSESFLARAAEQIVAPERGQPLSQLVWSGEG